MGRINTTWHQKHRMPPRPTLEQRVSWHVAHARWCGCRAMPATVIAELKRRDGVLPAKKR